MLVLYPYRKLSLARSVDNQGITVQDDDHCTCNLDITAVISIITLSITCFLTTHPLSKCWVSPQLTRGDPNFLSKGVRLGMRVRVKVCGTISYKDVC